MRDARDNKATEAQAYDALRAAQIHAETTTKPMKSSAKSCAVDAEAFFNKGMFGYAHEWACESLKYSVGIFHADYERIRAAK
jgi:hypothetical protein